MRLEFSDSQQHSSRSAAGIANTSDATSLFLGVPDGQHLWSTSKVNGYAYVYNLSDLKEVGRVFVGQHPEWFTFTPDGKLCYIAAAGDNSVTVVDVKTVKVVAHIPVGQVPKRNGTATMMVQ